LQAALAVGVFTLFMVSTVVLAAYGLHLYVLLALFVRRGGRRRAAQRETIKQFSARTSDDQWPVVTTQLPIYNEQDVAERVIAAVAAMNYPSGKHEIQVLDDSTDYTRDIVDRAVARLRVQGADIVVIRRPDRQGYKAGALSYGLTTAKGKYVAIFDADFAPPADFLRKAVPLLEADDKTACMQGRWSHLNREESWLTEAQALGIDGHFAIEQGARAWNDLMMNFNGTAGVWRKAALTDPAVGGWSADTLTEDLDISYRAQLAGWRIDYCFDMDAPAELPNTIEALKGQQRRWATGSIQVARKLLPRIWRSPLGLGEKLEATVHLTHYAVSFWMFVLAVATLPMSLYTEFMPGGYNWLRVGWFVILFATIAPSLVYCYARHVVGGRWFVWRSIGSMLVLGCGMCVNNTVAVFRGLLSTGGEFVRTPKSGSVGRQTKTSSYKTITSNQWLIELGMGAYSMLALVTSLLHVQRGIGAFLLLYTIGFSLTGWMSRPRRSVRRPVEEIEPAVAPFPAEPAPAN
jgi:cellulose synthase/poly-beta-1,6-N-acetylglucosamine synthase-like glycosyltransferase